jgi:hypothetical protein
VRTSVVSLGTSRDSTDSGQATARSWCGDVCPDRKTCKILWWKHCRHFLSLLLCVNRILRCEVWDFSNVVGCLAGCRLRHVAAATVKASPIVNGV